MVEASRNGKARTEERPAARLSRILLPTGSSRSVSVAMKGWAQSVVSIFVNDLAEAAADEILADGAGPDEIQAAGEHLADQGDGGAVPGAEGVAGDESGDLPRQADGGEEGGEEQEHRRAAHAALREHAGERALRRAGAEQRQGGGHRDHAAGHQGRFERTGGGDERWDSCGSCHAHGFGAHGFGSI